MSAMPASDVPRVAKELRAVVRSLAASGFTFKLVGNEYRLCTSTGAATELRFPKAGTPGARQDTKNLMRELRKRHWYPPDEPAAMGTLIHLPARATTAHQHRLSTVRERVLRVLRELGGNTREARRMFVEDALVTGVAHGLRVPAGADVYSSAAQSLRQLLNGQGQSGWMLDLWDLECGALEQPLPLVPGHLSTEVLPAPRTDPYPPDAPEQDDEPQVWPDEEPEEEDAAVQPFQANDDDGVLRTEVLAVSGSVRTGGGTDVLGGRGLRVKARPKTEDAAAWLRSAVEGAPLPRTELLRRGMAAGHAKPTLERARSEAGLVYWRTQGYQAGTMWGTPAQLAAWPGAMVPAPQAPPAPQRRSTARSSRGATDHVLARVQAQPTTGSLAQRQQRYLDELHVRAIAGDSWAAARYESLLGLG